MVRRADPRRTVEQRRLARTGFSNELETCLVAALIAVTVHSTRQLDRLIEAPADIRDDGVYGSGAPRHYSFAVPL